MSRGQGQVPPPKPNFRVLERVKLRPERLAEHHIDVADGIIVQVRLRGDGYVYGVAGEYPEGYEGDFGVDGLWGERDLISRGNAVDRSYFWNPGTFRVRDVVRVLKNPTAPQLAGVLAVVGEAEEQDHKILVHVMPMNGADGEILEERYLHATGERLAPLTIGQLEESEFVSPSGQSEGRSHWVLIDDLDRYL